MQAKAVSRRRALRIAGAALGCGLFLVIGPALSESSVPERLVFIITDVLGVEENEVTLESRFLEDLNADEYDMVELLMEVEEDFYIRINDDDADKVFKVEDLVKLIDSKRFE